MDSTVNLFEFPMYLSLKTLQVLHAVYVDIGANSGDTANLAFVLSGNNDNRIWDIKVTQIECTNRNRLKIAANFCHNYEFQKTSILPVGLAFIIATLRTILYVL